MLITKRLGAIAGVLGTSLYLMTSLPAVAAEGAATAAVKKNAASKVEKIDGSSLSRVTLTTKAAERLDIKIGKVAQQSGAKIVPYAALFYDAKGNAFVYTSPEPLVYVRAPVVVDSIQGANVVLKEGPADGTDVVVVGVAELWGAESGIGK